MPLLHRNCTPIRLTEAGKIYLEYVKQLVKAEASFHRQLSELEQAKRTRLQIAIPFQVIPQVFERFLRGFYSAYPNIDVTIKEGTSISAFQMLMDERVELAFFHSVEAEDPRLNRLILDKTELFLSATAAIRWSQGVSPRRMRRSRSRRSSCRFWNKCCFSARHPNTICTMFSQNTSMS